jgi:hypothetical protein
MVLMNPPWGWRAGAVHREPVEEDPLPRALGDGAPDVVGLFLGEEGGAQADGPVQERLSVIVAEVDGHRRL